MNNNPLSGLMTSMNRVKNQRFNSVSQGDIANQAGTLPAVQEPTMPTIKPTNFTQVLPAPQQPVAQPQPAVQSVNTQVGTQFSPEESTVIRTTKDMLNSDTDLSLPDAFVLSLGYLFGVSKPQTPAQ